MSDYLPGVGTSAAKIISYLHLIPEDAEVGSATISEATGVSSADIINSGDRCVMAGYMLRTKVGYKYFYKRGHKSPPQEYIERHRPAKMPELDYVPKATNGHEGAAQIVVGQVMGSGFNPGPPQGKPEESSLTKKFADPRILDDEERSPVMEMRDKIMTEGVPPAREKTKMMKVPVAATDMKVGIFSDGSLTIERRGRTENYSPEEVVTLVRFLDRMMLKNGSIAQ